MDISTVISKSDYDNIKHLSYDKFCHYVSMVVKLSVEESLKALPGVIQHLSSQVTYLKTLSENFYKTNKDLVPYRRLVAELIEEVESTNPGLRYEEVLEKAAGRARRFIANPTLEQGPGRKNLEFYDSRLKDI